MKKCIRLRENDNVATLLNEAVSGDVFSVCSSANELCGSVTAAADIPFAHKIALKDIKNGEEIVKMDAVIGLASKDIPCGTHVHIHNVLSIEGMRGIKE